MSPTYAYDIMFTFAHVFHIRQRKVLSENEWAGWLQWTKSAFQEGEIMQMWVDPAFQEFVDKEIIPKTQN